MILLVIFPADEAPYISLALGMLTRAGPQLWVQEELVELTAMSFKFQSKRNPASYATALANNMQLYPPQHILNVSMSILFTLLPASLGTSCATSQANSQTRMIH